MSFEYDVKFYRGPEEEFDFPSLMAGASMWCAEHQQAQEIAAAFNQWAFRMRSPYIANPLRVSPKDPKKKGWRVWIINNEHGADAYGVDPLPIWAELRVERAGQEPAEGWPKTSDLYRDFIGWATARGLKKTLLPPANTFTQNAKRVIDAKFARRSDGMRVIGAVLKKTDLENANSIDHDEL